MNETVRQIDNHASQDAFLGELQREIEARQAVVIVGAGVSRFTAPNAPAADWDGLLRHGVDYCYHHTGGDNNWVKTANIKIASGDVDEKLHVASEVAQKLGAPDRGKFREWLQTSVGGLTPAHGELIRTIQEFRSLILTTNYDSLIELVTNFETVTQNDPKFYSALRGEISNVVVHLHGHWRQPGSVVLHPGDYADTLASKDKEAMLRALFALRTVIFIGFGAGISDPHFSSLRDWMRAQLGSVPFRHYRFVIEGDLPAARLDHLKDRIYPIGYGPSHKELPPLLRRLQPMAVQTTTKATHVLILPGVIGPERQTLRFRQMIEECGTIQGGVSAQIWDWTQLGENTPAQDRLTDRRLHDRCAHELADRIREWRADHQNVILHLIGTSGGARVVILACLQLADRSGRSDEKFFGKIIFLSAAVPRKTDLSAALELASQRVYSFHSPKDRLLFFSSISTATRLAGRKGFAGRGASSVQQLQWKPWMNEGTRDAHGDHLGCMNLGFAREVILPLLTGERDSWPGRNGVVAKPKDETT